MTSGSEVKMHASTPSLPVLFIHATASAQCTILVGPPGRRLGKKRERSASLILLLSHGPPSVVGLCVPPPLTAASSTDLAEAAPLPCALLVACSASPSCAEASCVRFRGCRKRAPCVNPAAHKATTIAARARPRPSAPPPPTRKPTLAPKETSARPTSRSLKAPPLPSRPWLFRRPLFRPIPPHFFQLSTRNASSPVDLLSFNISF
mmetsp:Transcript_11105/g.27238  ORF Transcript_11105/g.27238 Transcript_11105/m.27238 type:complete len:206 (+) Transcript_11105:779-1396(+)